MHRKQRKILEPGDLEEGIRAAGAVGDDRIQRQTQGYVVPDAFTHGSAQQRAGWFRRGLESGSMGACDTFSAASRRPAGLGKVWRRRGGMPVLTVGHSTRSLAELIELLIAADVTDVIDVRAFPRSRRHPQFNIETLPSALAAAGIGYAHMPALGGRRGRQPGIDASLNGYWKNQSFHNFADYALTQPFADALAAVRTMARHGRPALMCAEALWQNCHRRLIADHLLAAGESVLHIIGKGRIEAAVLTPAAVVGPAGRVIYPPVQSSLL